MKKIIIMTVVIGIALSTGAIAFDRTDFTIQPIPVLSRLEQQKSRPYYAYCPNMLATNSFTGPCPWNDDGPLYKIFTEDPPQTGRRF